MSRQAVVNAIGGLLCAVLAAGAASAAGRESGSRDHSDKKAETSATSRGDDWRQGLEGWLARLQGKFTIKLETQPKIVCPSRPSTVQGDMQVCKMRKVITYSSAGSCLRIGDGPGLKCTFDQLRYADADPGSPTAQVILMSNTLPREVTFGIDPDARKISVKFSGSQGETTATAKPMGNELTFKGRCVRSSMVSGACTWGLSIKAPPDGHRILMTRSGRFSSGGSDTPTLSDMDDPHTFELTRVE